jgi:uncharacterized protein
MYEFTVPVYKQILGAQIALIDKAIAHGAEHNLPDSALLQEKLADDMRPLQFQWQNLVGHSASAIARFIGAPALARDGETLAALKQQLTDAVTFLGGVKPSDLNGKEEMAISFEPIPGRVLKFAGRDYLSSFAMPNFMFHAATAYDILRKNGLAIGKRDFMGAVKFAP